MMNITQEIRGFLKSVRLISGDVAAPSLDQNASSFDYHMLCSQDDMINVDQINFGDDETWLYKSTLGDGEVTDLQQWLYSEDNDVHSHLSTERKGIDSRTFTRPKKRITRPSIQQYNDNYFQLDATESTMDNRYLSDLSDLMSDSQDNLLARVKKAFLKGADHSKRNSIEENKIEFDLSQPTTSSIFDRIGADAQHLDAFQNMSPPSLVHSLCSSTFTSLMENSFIKNDPVLREIRDTDYTDVVLLQDCDPPLFKSFNESVNSLTFLSETYDKLGLETSIGCEEKENLNKTFDLKSAFCDGTYSEVVKPTSGSTILRPHTNNTDLNATVTLTSSPQFNGTYRKPTLKHHGTFRKSSMTNSSEHNSGGDSLNQTVILRNNVSNQTDNTSTMRHSYVIADSGSGHISKGSSVDSLDSGHNSPYKSCGKMLNMAEVDAIIMQQEQSLPQVMSTPKHVNKLSRPWQNNEISPIAHGASDSDTSDDYVTQATPAMAPPPHVEPPIGRKPKGSPAKQSTNNYSTYSRPAKQPINVASNLNATSTRLRGNLAHATGSQTNLTTMTGHLKRSYTQLKPVLKHLPAVEPTEPQRIAESQVAPTVRDRPQHVRSAGASCKPPGRMSSLPRPVSGASTGIPRPVSKIPGPKTFRPMGQQHLSVRMDDRINDDF